MENEAKVAKVEAGGQFLWVGFRAFLPSLQGGGVHKNMV